MTIDRNMKIPTEQIKTLILGSVGKIKATGNHKPDPAKIQEVVKNGAFIGSFCTGCGFTQGFSQKGAKDITEALDLKLPKSSNKIYFTTSRCTLCDDDFKEIKIQTR